MYKVGDKVRIRKDLIVGNLYHDEEIVVDAMLDYRGITTTIKDVAGEDLYFLSCDHGCWYWPGKTLITIGYINFDKIKEMSMEELAKFLCEKFSHGIGEDLILKWLRQKAE